MSLFASLLASFAPSQETPPAPTAPPAAEAKAPTVEEIVAKANQVAYYAGRDGRAQVQMEIVDAQGRKREREMTILRLDLPKPGSAADAPNDEEYCGEQRFYVRFKQPADVDKTTFLVWKKPGEDDDRWLYLPALDLVKRVSSADK
ncbi:MAG: outer membrane lipoprotein-sorting protein, partial [Planctomycetes bacterium]|nr:outer membrane lipoprotein-sorting protein [Planctomycetota bacterium]